MAGIFVDGYAHYGTNNIVQKYTTITGTSNVFIDPTPPAGRIGPAIEMTTGGQVSKTLSYHTEWILGVAFRTSGNSFGWDIWQGDHVNVPLFSLHVENDGTLTMYAGGSGNFPSIVIFNSGTVGFSIHENTWYYVEVSLVITGGANISVAAELRINGSSLGSGSANTGVNENSLLNHAAVGAAINNWAMKANGVGSTWYKDLYMFDTSTAFANSFAGDVTFVTVFPDGDVITDWTPTGGGTSFNQVNENPPDGDVTYIEDGTPGDLDEFTFQDLPALSGSIVTAQYLVFGRKTAEGTKSIKQTVGAGILLESPEWFLPDDYIYNHFCIDVDPNTSAPWTVPGFNGTDFGVEVAS